MQKGEPMATAMMEIPAVRSQTTPASLAAIHEARNRVVTDRTAALASLDALFQGGTMPRDLSGPYTGILVTTTFGRWPDRLVRVWARRNLRWLGKRFTATGGDNIWRRYRGAGDHVFWALNRQFGWRAIDDSPETYRAFPFRTAVGRGVADRECTVLKIVYDSRPNPLPVRQVLDELVALGDGVYLGKAHGRLLGRWRLLAYFALVGEVCTSQ
jgi:hypothetical protein